MDAAEADPWSEVADGWAELWADLPAPAWSAVLDAVRPDPGALVLDVGCGTGELLAHLARLGLRTAGADPAAGMVERARTTAPDADLRTAGAEELPWPDGTFDLVTAVNALQLADDPEAAIAELVRVTAPGGHVAVVCWAEAARNDLGTIERAVALDAGDDPGPDGELKQPGALERLLRRADLDVVGTGVTEVPWTVADGQTLVRGILLGEDSETMASTAPVVLAAAEPFRVAGGGYRLVNHLRHVVGRKR